MVESLLFLGSSVHLHALLPDGTRVTADRPATGPTFTENQPVWLHRSPAHELRWT